MPVLELLLLDSMIAFRWVRSKEKPAGAAVGVGVMVNSDMAALLFVVSVLHLLDVQEKRREIRVFGSARKIKRGP